MTRRAIETFCDELTRRVPTHIEPILLGRKDEVGKQNLGQDPEQFINQYLTWPVYNAVSHDGTATPATILSCNDTLDVGAINASYIDAVRRGNDPLQP